MSSLTGSYRKRLGDASEVLKSGDLDELYIYEQFVHTIVDYSG